LKKVFPRNADLVKKSLKLALDGTTYFKYKLAHLIKKEEIVQAIKRACFFLGQVSPSSVILQ
jgi:hypothetical protein